MEGLVLALSDQQLLVGLAILVAGFVQHCSISVYHFSIIYDLAWFSSNTHMTTLSVLRARLVEEPSLLKWRVSLIILMALFLCTGISLEGHRDWYQSYHAPAQCLFNDLPGNFSGEPARWSVAQVILIVLWYSVVISWLYYNDALHSFFFEKPIRRVNTFQGTVHNKRCLWRTARGVRAITAFTILRPVEILLRMSAKLHAGVLTLMGSITFGLIFDLGFFAWGLLDVISDRSIPSSEIVGDENKWGFGQIVPVFLLASIVLSFKELHTGKNLPSELPQRPMNRLITNCKAFTEQGAKLRKRESRAAAQQQRGVTQGLGQSPAKGGDTSAASSQVEPEELEPVHIPPRRIDTESGRRR
ncbi:MAG: hypothetical protein LQ345_002814 [Seirophora villosa]|nr:MAG: hypothetical protein LQ345_002814 [Seirophora villosa]